MLGKIDPTPSREKRTCNECKKVREKGGSLGIDRLRRSLRLVLAHRRLSGLPAPLELISAMSTLTLTLVIALGTVWLAFGIRAFYVAWQHDTRQSNLPAFGNPGLATLIPFGLMAYLFVKWAIAREERN